MIATMADTYSTRVRRAAAGLCVAALTCGAGGMLLSADTAPVRLLGVTTEGSAVVIEATEPVAYAVSKPDPLTLIIDMRNVSAADAANHAVRRGAVAAVNVEQTTAVDGRAVARVRLSLSRPAEHKVRSARNTIRVELHGAQGGAATSGPLPLPAPAVVTVSAVDTPAPVEPERPLTMEQALANAASLAPTDAPAADPFSALQIGARSAASSAAPSAIAAAPVVPPVRPSPAPADPARSGARAYVAPPERAGRPVAEAPPRGSRSEATRQAAPLVRRETAPVVQQRAAAQSPSTATTQQQIVGANDKKYTGHPITMDFQGVDLRSVLRTFAEISGLNMVIDPDVQGTVDMILTEVPWDQALEVILRGNSLDYTVDGSIVRVAKIDTLKKEQESKQQLARASADAGTLAVRTFSLSYAKAAAAAPLVKRAVLSPRGDVQIDERTNTLIITDLPARLETVTQLLSTIDRAEPQVEVEARVVQTTREFAQAVGIQWGLNGRVAAEHGNTPALAFPNNGSVVAGANHSDLGVGVANSAIGLALGSINGAFNLDVALSALERSGKGRILSTPRLTTQNNIEAEVAQGVQIPIQTVANNTVTVSFKDAVLVLKVTPQITSAGTVIMRITIENATADFSRQVNGIPPIDTQRANTTVQVNDGSTTIIGGIFVSQEQTSNQRTPVLHRIPLLGWLFKRDSQQDQSRELLIFITPRILKG